MRSTVATPGGVGGSGGDASGLNVALPPGPAELAKAFNEVTTLKLPLLD